MLVLLFFFFKLCSYSWCISLPVQELRETNRRCENERAKGVAPSWVYSRLHQEFLALDPPALGLFSSCWSKSSSVVQVYILTQKLLPWAVNGGLRSRSLLQGPQFDPELELLSVWSCACFPTWNFHRFPLTSQNHISRWTGYAKSGWVINVYRLCPEYPRIGSRYTVNQTRMKPYLYLPGY